MEENHLMRGVAVGGSFRDPSSFVFLRDGVPLRQVNEQGRDAYVRLMRSGCYTALVGAGLLIPHEEIGRGAALMPESAYTVLRPTPVPMVSYPYEWSVGQLHDAALATLDIQRRALAFGLSLVDASAYNIQFVGGRPVLIDTLSLVPYHPGAPWGAYRQFCEHFLAPLALMSARDARFGQLIRSTIDGIPLDFTSALLPWRTKLRPGIALHLVAHAWSQRRHESRPLREDAGRGFSRRAFLGLLQGLEETIRHCAWEPSGTTWAAYYDGDSYSASAFAEKQRIVGQYLDTVHPTTVWDFGANTGAFSALAAQRGAHVTAFDNDVGAVELHYRSVRERGERRVLPLFMDLANPSPALGWAHEERLSLQARGPVDCLLALALLHHLAIGRNVPLERIAALFASLASMVILEFIPKEDQKVRQLLASRADIFPTYTYEGVLHAFAPHFSLVQSQVIPGSLRTLLLLRTLRRVARSCRVGCRGQ